MTHEQNNHGRKKISGLVKRAVTEAVQEIFSDPDFGLELQDWVKKRLAKKPGKTILLEKLREKYI